MRMFIGITLTILALWLKKMAYIVSHSCVIENVKDKQHYWWFPYILLWFDAEYVRLSTDVTVRKLQYRVGTVIRVSTQRRRHNFIVIPPYFNFYTRSRSSSPFPGKALALRTDSNGLSDPVNDEGSVGIERVQERRRARFSSLWSDCILLNFGVFACTENYIPACMAESVEISFCTVARRRNLVLGFCCS